MGLFGGAKVLSDSISKRRRKFVCRWDCQGGGWILTILSVKHVAVYIRGGFHVQCWWQDLEPPPPPLSGIFIVKLVFKTKTHGLDIRVQKKKIIHQQQNVFSIWMKIGSSSLLAENWRVKCFWRRGQRRRREGRELFTSLYVQGDHLTFHFHTLELESSELLLIVSN